MLLNNPLFRTILHLLSVNGAGHLVLLLISVIIFRTVDKSYYGLYVIMLSLFAVVELLMAGFNDSIVRFLKDKIPLNDKKNIVLFVLYYKYLLIFLFISCIYIARQYGFFEFLIGNYDEVSDVIDSFILVVILNGILSTFIGVNFCILNSQQKYKLTANIALVRNVVYLIVVFSLSLYTNDYLHYLYSSIALSAIVLIYLSIRIFQDFKEFSIFNIIKSKFSIDIGRKYIFPYSTPLTASSLLTYVKNYLPTIILGKEFSLENVAVFSILKTFFKALHSVSGSFIDPMMSKFLELKNNAKDFSVKMSSIFWGTFLLRLSLFAILALLVQYIFLVYKIENSEVHKFIFYVLGIEFIIAGMILIYGIILRLDKTTSKVFIASLVRFGVELSLIYLILLDYGIIAAALILLIARYIETVITYLYVIKEGIFRSHFVLILCFSPVIIYCLSRLN